MDEQTSGMVGDIGESGLQYARDQFEQVRQQTEDYVRENPTQSLGYALAAGFIFHLLPVGRILGGLVRLVMIALKPAILVYGVTKLYQAAKSEEL